MNHDGFVERYHEHIYINQKGIFFFFFFFCVCHIDVLGGFNSGETEKHATSIPNNNIT